jgi:tRNA dimethylallyltransferase
LILRVICGPTGGGKSALAMRLAEKEKIAVISADSRQIYRGFDVGTAKADRAEQARVPHYGIDVVDPDERYSAARFAEDAKRWIADAISKDLTPVIVGGTGLYIKALFEPLSPVPDIDPGKRAELDTFLRERTTDELRRWCELLDPRRSGLGKTQLIRAIETALLAGKRLSEIHERHQGNADQDAETRAGLAARYLIVDPGGALIANIENRFDRMIERGWLDEVRRLAGQVPESAPAWKAAGYSAVLAVARGESDLATARSRVIIETRQYAKRQRTWFRNQLPVGSATSFDPESPGGDLFVQRWWHEGRGVE